MAQDTQIQRGTHERPSFLLCVPTLGMVPIEWCVAFSRLAVPVNAITYSSVITNTEVGVARCSFAEEALRMKPQPKAVLFIGDDMIPPYDGLLKLYDAFEEGQYDVLAGLYFMKQEYPVPIMWRRDIVGPMREYRDYQPGEVVDCDVVGMDFTLIRPSIFEKIEKPYFYTGTVVTADGGRLTRTEDVYFCDKVREVGGRIGCHTGVRVSHLYHKTGEVF